MTRLLIAFFALVALPAYAQEGTGTGTGTGQFVPILDEERGALWIVDTETGEVRTCYTAFVEAGPATMCSRKE